MRITNKIRDKIEDALIDRGYKAKLKALQDREHALADKLYRSVVPAELEKAADKFNELVGQYESCHYTTWIDSTNAVMVHVPGALKSNYIKFNLSHMRPWASFHSVSLVLDKLADDLREEVEAHRNDQAALYTEIKTRRAEISGILEKVFTPAKLRAVWPDVMPVAEPILIEAGCAPKPQLPAIDVTVLNAALDLPPETEKKELEAA